MDYSLPGSSVMGFPRQEYWSGLSCPSLSAGELLDPGIKSPTPALAGIFLTTELPGKPLLKYAAAAAAKLLQSCPTLVRPQGQQPTRLHCPWDSPGKNTGVGCHFLLQCMKVKSESEAAQSCPTLSDPMDCSLPGSSVHGIFQARIYFSSTKV